MNFKGLDRCPTCLQCERCGGVRFQTVAKARGHHTLSGIPTQPETSKYVLMKASSPRNKISQKYSLEKLNYLTSSVLYVRKTNAIFSCLTIPLHNDMQEDGATKKPSIE